MIFKAYNAFTYAFIISVSIICFGLGIYFVDIKPPKFREEIEQRLTNDSILMQKIGGWKSTEFNYEDDKENNNIFSFTVVGNCDSAYVKINGLYTKDKFTVTDSVIRSCK